MLAIVNKPYSQQISYPVSASDIRKWAVAVYYPQQPPARYVDRRVVENGDLVAPLDFNPFGWGAATTIAATTDPAYQATSSLELEMNLGVVPPDVRHAINGGVSATYSGIRMRPGDVVTSVSRIGSYSERKGRLGTMLITDVAHTWTNQRGAEIKTYQMTLIRY
jgi:hypothetical protein